jgi:hypothetical protein
MGRLFQGCGNFPEKGHKDKGIPEVKEPGNYIDPEGIIETDAFNQYKVGNKTAAEEHGDGSQHHIDLVAHEVPFGKCIGDHGSKEDTANGGNEGPPDGDIKGLYDIFIHKDRFVTVQSELAGPPVNTAQHGVCGLIQRYHHGVPYRVQGYKTDQDHEQFKGPLTYLCPHDLAVQGWFMLIISHSAHCVPA